MAQRHQNGHLRKADRKDGLVWEFLWREPGPDGRLHQKTHVIGSVKRFTEKAAMLEVEALRSQANRNVPLKAVSSFKELAEKYKQHEMTEDRMTAKTRGTYESYLKIWIIPRWGEARLGEIRPVAMETWLRSLDLANGSKAKIRNIMHTIYRHAIREGVTANNPISTVRQSAKRQKIPVVLEIDELKKLFAELHVRERAMVISDALTGLRRGELFGLKWGDVDFLAMSLSVVRSYVDGHEGDCKTEASRKPVPMQEGIAQALLEWKKALVDAGRVKTGPEDWVFASEHSEGKRPYWPATIMRYFIRPAARRAGITKHFSWHTFRHTFASVICSQGTEGKVVQELLRHASMRTTMDVYTQANEQQKREAQDRLAERIM